MNEAEERLNWETHKQRRSIHGLVRPEGWNRTCYEVFDSFDEFALNGRPYQLNGVGGLPPRVEPPTSPDEFDFLCDFPPRRGSTRHDDGDESDETDSQPSPSRMSPMTEALIQARATGSSFKGWVGATGAQQMKIMIDANIPMRWMNPFNTARAREEH
jgi:hypothetical protein